MPMFALLQWLFSLILEALKSIIARDTGKSSWSSRLVVGLSSGLGATARLEDEGRGSLCGLSGGSGKSR